MKRKERDGPEYALCKKAVRKDSFCWFPGIKDSLVWQIDVMGVHSIDYKQEVIRIQTENIGKVHIMRL